MLVMLCWPVWCRILRFQPEVESLLAASGLCKEPPGFLCSAAHDLSLSVPFGGTATSAACLPSAEVMTASPHRRSVPLQDSILVEPITELRELAEEQVPDAASPSWQSTRNGKGFGGIRRKGTKEENEQALNALVGLMQARD